MDIPTTPPGDRTPEAAVLVGRATQWYVECTGFLLPDVWFPRAVLMELGRRSEITTGTVHTSAVQELIARGWFRASPNGQWLKLLPTDEQRATWERQSASLRARRLMEDTLLGIAYDLQDAADDETLALVLRQLVHLARIAAAAQDVHVAAMLVCIAAGFERLGMLTEAHTAYGDAVRALLQRREALKPHL